MTPKIKRVLLFQLCLFSFTCRLFAHLQLVHAAITGHAIEAANGFGSYGFSAFCNIVSNDIPFFGTGGVSNRMVAGSWDEDFHDEPNDVGGKRPYNHFFDPLTGKGLSDYPYVSDAQNERITMGTNSFAWASISNCPGINFYGYGIVGALPKKYSDQNLNTSNIWTWQNARGYEFEGLLAPNQITRPLQNQRTKFDGSNHHQPEQEPVIAEP